MKRISLLFQGFARSLVCAGAHERWAFCLQRRRYLQPRRRRHFQRRVDGRYRCRWLLDSAGTTNSAGNTTAAPRAGGTASSGSSNGGSVAARARVGFGGSGAGSAGSAGNAGNAGGGGASGGGGSGGGASTATAIFEIKGLMGVAVTGTATFTQGPP